MYEVIIYETSAGVKPLRKYLKNLSKQHKEENVIRIMAMIKDLEEFGFGLKEKDKYAIKPIGNQIYELRPIPSRIFFFHHVGDTFVLLHGFEKKCNKTPQSEIIKAEKERDDYIKRYGK